MARCRRKTYRMCEQIHVARKLRNLQPPPQTEAQTLGGGRRGSGGFLALIASLGGTGGTEGRADALLIYGAQVNCACAIILINVRCQCMTMGNGFRAEKLLDLACG